MPTTMLLGNTAPLMADGTRAEHVTNTITTVVFPDDVFDLERVELSLSTPNELMLTMIGERLAQEDRRYALAVNETVHLWSSHSADMPEWVESEDEGLARVVAAQFTGGNHECQVGRPDGWQEG